MIVPVSTGMVTAFKMNAKTEQLMQAELAVSSAAEALMSKGIDGTVGEYPDVNITTVPVKNADDVILHYKVTITSENIDSVKVETCIRAIEPTEAGVTS